MRKSALILYLTFISIACSAESQIDDSYTGFWENIDERYNNWWEIKKNRVINYGTEKTLACQSSDAKIVGENSFIINFGNEAHVNLKRDGNLLIFSTRLGEIKHKPVDKTAICKRNEKYYSGAPYQQ